MISWDVVFMYCQPLLVTLSSVAKATKRSSLVRLDQAIVSCHMRDILSYSYVRGTACIMMSQGPYLRYCLSSSLVPRLSWNAKMYRGESLVYFLRKHDVRNQNKTKTERQCFARCSTNYASTLGVHDIRRPIARYV